MHRFLLNNYNLRTWNSPLQSWLTSGFASAILRNKWRTDATQGSIKKKKHIFLKIPKLLKIFWMFPLINPYSSLSLRIIKLFPLNNPPFYHTHLPFKISNSYFWRYLENVHLPPYQKEEFKLCKSFEFMTNLGVPEIIASLGALSYNLR